MSNNKMNSNSERNIIFRDFRQNLNRQEQAAYPVHRNNFLAQMRNAEMRRASMTPGLPNRPSLVRYDRFYDAPPPLELISTYLENERIRRAEAQNSQNASRSTQMPELELNNNEDSDATTSSPRKKKMKTSHSSTVANTENGNGQERNVENAENVPAAPIEEDQIINLDSSSSEDEDEDSDRYIRSFLSMPSRSQADYGCSTSSQSDVCSCPEDHIISQASGVHNSPESPNSDDQRNGAYNGQNYYTYGNEESSSTSRNSDGSGSSNEYQTIQNESEDSADYETNNTTDLTPIWNDEEPLPVLNPNESRRNDAPPDIEMEAIQAIQNFQFQIIHLMSVRRIRSMEDLRRGSAPVQYLFVNTIKSIFPIFLDYPDLVIESQMKLMERVGSSCIIKTLNELSPSRLVTGDDLEESCVICQSSFESNQRVRCLCCGHKFHGKCIDTWCKTALTCPICRRGFDGNPLQDEEYIQRHCCPILVSLEHIRTYLIRRRYSQDPTNPIPGPSSRPC